MLSPFGVWSHCPFRRWNSKRMDHLAERANEGLLTDEDTGV
jgi:hypothetical protein